MKQLQARLRFLIAGRTVPYATMDVGPELL